MKKKKKETEEEQEKEKRRETKQTNSNNNKNNNNKIRGHAQYNLPKRSCKLNHSCPALVAKLSHVLVLLSTPSQCVFL